MTNEAEAHKRYPMLQTKVANMSDYVAPDDYHRLLKPYVFDGKSDLEMIQESMREYLDVTKDSRGKITRALELGCGTGRVTDAVREIVDIDSLHLLDLSPQMLASVKEKYADSDEIEFIQSDSIEYLEQSDIDYDVIYTLWSFSHSVHQILDDHAYLHDVFRVQNAMKRMVRTMMKPGGFFYLTHVDTMSDEQRHLFRQWAREFPMFGDDQHQSPSKLLLDDVFEELEETDEISDLRIERHLGDPIEYSSMEEALDIYLNFHLESHFNEKPEALEVAEDLENSLREFEEDDGRLLVRPGCITYQFQKNT